MGTLGYYTALARMQPGALAGAAVRRAQGLARQALYRRRDAVDELALRRALGAGDAEGLVAAALDPRTGTRAWCDAGARASALAALDAACPGGRARALARADAALRGAYDVFGTPVVFGEGRPVDWALDAGSGHRWPVAPVETLKLLVPGADPKAAWVLGRLDCAVALAQGAWAAEDAAARARYADAFVARVLDFLSANPVGQGVQWTCAMEVALRAANLAQGLAMLAQAPQVRSPGFAVPALCALAEHAQFVLAHLEDHGAVPNNHLVSNWAGLLVVGALFPRLPGLAGLAQRAAAGLRAEMAAQVHADGASFEGSVPYHRLSAELFALGLLAARAAGVELGGPYEARLGAMLAAAGAWCSEAGLAPQVGDNDSGRAWPLCARGDTEQGYLAPFGAALLGRPAPGGGAFPDEAAWLLGLEGLTRYRATPPAPLPRVAAFRDAGLYVLRAGGATVTVCAGPNGQGGVGGHSHNDKLSFELHLDGRPLVVDPGTGTYTRAPALRNALRATAAHNTPQVDGEEQAPLDAGRLFALPEAAGARALVLQEGPELVRLVARHDGYRRLPRPVGVERTFVLDARTRTLAVADTFEGGGLHNVAVRLHLPDAHARLRAPSEAERARARCAPGGPRDPGPVAVELGPAGAARALVLFDAGWTPGLVPGRFSHGYGRVAESLTVVVERQLVLPEALHAVVVFLD